MTQTNLVSDFIRTESSVYEFYSTQESAENALEALLGTLSGEVPEGYTSFKDFVNDQFANELDEIVQAHKAKDNQINFGRELYQKLETALKSDLDIMGITTPIIRQNYVEKLAEFFTNENGEEVTPESFEQFWDGDMENMYQNFLECNPELQDNLDLVAEQNNK